MEWSQKYNASGTPLIYSTLQAYLKDSRVKLQKQLVLAREEGWTLAIKLVRGAYINNDIRERIHDTKADTDKSYNSIVKDVLERNFPGLDQTADMRLFLAGHNQISVDLARETVDKLADQGQLTIVPEFGQLQGMADELGCNLLMWSEERNRKAAELSQSKRLLPIRVYKYMTWGSTQECTEYLYRRAVENRGAAERMRDDMAAMRKELKDRFFHTLLGKQRQRQTTTITHA